ncbi:MAG: NAD(P)/FAD-dependent oxidoreductase [Crocosphaera sp.]
MQLSKQKLQENTEKVYDTIVIGGGAGGLSAGIYLQRYLLSSLIIDKGKARSFWMQELHNYLGLPPDTPGRNLLKQGKDHYLSLGGDLLNGYVEEVIDEGDTFLVRVKVGRNDSIYAEFRSKYIIAASGIIDNLPFLDDMQNVYEYAGYNLHVCLICDGYEMVDKKVGIFGKNQRSLEVAFSLGWFTPHITLFTQDMFDVSLQFRERLEDHGYELVEEHIEQFVVENHQMTGVQLMNGSVINLDAGLISMGSQYHSGYLSSIDLQRQGENLVTDRMCRTSHPRIFAIGDLKVGLNQVVIAAADGALAASGIWQEIRTQKKVLNKVRQN